MSLWGEVRLERCHDYCRAGCYKRSRWSDESLDESGLLPEVLLRLEEMAKLLPYRQTEQLLERWGVDISKSQVARLDEQLNTVRYTQGRQDLEQLAQQPLALRDGEPQCWIIEIDGKLVPVYNAQKHEVEWREVKTAVLYPMNQPGQRCYVSDLGHHSGFAPLVHGLLRQAGLAQNDELIAVSDGAKWIASLMEDLGVETHILDVFHASLYLETLMLALGWDEVTRQRHRKQLLQGETNISTWLKHNIQASKTWTGEAHQALHYLKKQAQAGHCSYQTFKAQGFEVIASGQIEGANKSVIGARLNISGAHWSEAGARHMAFARSQFFSLKQLADFSTLRHYAFPQVA